jgi:hypothetical protein
VKPLLTLLVVALLWPQTANAASLPAPAKLCAIIAKGITGNNLDTWQPSTNHEYYCRGTAVIDFQLVPYTPGETYMAEYSAGGPTKNRVSRVYFRINISGFQLAKDQVAAPILSRMKNIFAAANAGAVPDDLVNDIDTVTTASVSTALGVVRTRFTPGTNDKINGSTFEVQLDVAPT